MLFFELVRDDVDEPKPCYLRFEQHQQPKSFEKDSNQVTMQAKNDKKELEQEHDSIDCDAK